MPQQKPVSPVPLSLGNIPKRLKEMPRWILWKYTRIETPKGPKWTKTPHSATNGHKIDATNFDNGVDFITAAQSLKTKKATFDGLGFLLGDGIAGIDVDDCIDSDGNLDDRGTRMSQAYAGTYAEVSPSGQGFKIIVDVGSDPKLASIGKNSGGMEIYGGRRYFTVTGSLLPGHPKTVAEMSAAFAQTAEEMGVNRARPVQGPTDIETDKARLGIDLVGARDLLDHLPFHWCDEYGDWLRAGMALHHEFGGSGEALELWDEWSQRNPAKYDPNVCAMKWPTFGRPGKEPVTIRTLVRDASAGGWRAPNTIEQAIRDFTVLDDTPGVDETSGEVIEDWWSRYSVGPMLRTQPEPLRWVWAGLLLESKVLVLAGSGGSSKSYLMLAAATQYALGQSWGPFELKEGHKRGRALILYGEEDYQDVHHRIHSLQHSFMLSNEQVALAAQNLAVLPLRGQDVALAEYGPDDREVIITKAARKIEERIRQYEVKLLILDPMAMLHGLDENDNRAIGHFVRELDAICMRSGASIILVHHFSKAVARAREINEANVRGASSLVAHARTVAVMHRLRRDEAAEWGVPEDEHSRWTMFNIVKNNYGPAGRITWFNVNATNGVISPSETQLTFMNSRDIRMAALAAVQETQVSQDQELSDAEERRARQVAEQQIQNFRYMEYILRESLERYEGAVPSMSRCRELILGMDANATGRAARVAIEELRSREYITESGRNYRVSDAGRQWLEDREVLS